MSTDDTDTQLSDVSDFRNWGGGGGGGGAGGGGYFLIWPIRGSAARQGMVLVLSVLNRVYHLARVFPETLDRVYNFAQVCPKQYTCHLS